MSEIVLTVKAGFPVNKRGDQFSINVQTFVEEPSDDYDERMRVLASTFEKLAEEIRSKHD